MHCLHFCDLLRCTRWIARGTSPTTLFQSGDLGLHSVLDSLQLGQEPPPHADNVWASSVNLSGRGLVESGGPVEVLFASAVRRDRGDFLSGTRKADRRHVGGPKNGRGDYRFPTLSQLSTILPTKARTPSTLRGAVPTMIRTLRPLARLPSSVGAGPSRPIAFARSFQTGYQKPSSGPVDLAYDVIEPKHPSGLHGDQCLVICHGLFGSKQNWRSLSKRFAQELGMPVYCLVSTARRNAMVCN